MVTFLLVLAATSSRQDLLEEVGVGQLLAGGLLQQRLQPLAALEQAQLQKVLGEPFELGGVHATSSSSSYTARSRTSTPCS